jgi:hypothetical protein
VDYIAAWFVSIFLNLSRNIHMPNSIDWHLWNWRNCGTNRNAYNKQKQKFFRVEEYFQNYAGSKVYFETNIELALHHVKGMKLENVSSKAELNRIDSRVVIQPFMAYTCDFEGWENSDFENYDLITYVQN